MAFVTSTTSTTSAGLFIKFSDHAHCFAWNLVCECLYLVPLITRAAVPSLLIYAVSGLYSCWVVTKVCDELSVRVQSVYSHLTAHDL